MATDVISPDLKSVLRRLKLGRLLDTLPERLVLARQQKLPHQDFFLLVLSDEVSRRREAIGDVWPTRPSWQVQREGAGERMEEALVQSQMKSAGVQQRRANASSARSRPRAML